MKIKIYTIIYWILTVLYVVLSNILLGFDIVGDLLLITAIIFVFIGLNIITGISFLNIVSVILESIYYLYLVAQKVYLNSFSSYFRLSTVFELGKEVYNQKAAVKELTSLIDFVPLIIWWVVNVVFIVLINKQKKENKTRLKRIIVGILCLILSFVFLFVNKNMHKQNINEEDNFQIYKSDYYLYETVNNPVAFVEKFGILNFVYRDIELTIENNKNLNDFKDDIDIYFENKDNNGKQNDYYGLFKDKNLLIIQAESLTNLAISEELTPCLYYLKNNSIEFTNFSTPLLLGSTSDSEFMTNTSFIPESEGYSVCYKYVENSYPLTLGNLFKDNGYKTTAYHNNYGEYYNRNVVFEKYGYKFMDCIEFGLESENPDTEISEHMGWVDCEKEKFISFWISYSGHSPYGLDDVGVNEENIEKIRSLYPDLDDEYVSYLAKIMDFDQAVQQYINIIGWMNDLDNLAIIVYGDHTTKGLDFSKSSNYSKVFGVNSDDNPEITNTPLFVYTNGLEHQIVNKYCTCLDLLPTICNLWGIDYDSKYCFGNDILNDDYDGFCFDSNGNYWNSNFYYDSTLRNVTANNNYSINKAQSIINSFEEKREICKKILKIDYLKKLDKK